MIGDEKAHVSVSVGGTVVAVFIALIVFTISYAIVSTLAGLSNYYLASMRMEAAKFMGGIIGSVAGVFSSRMACDAIIKSYSGKAIFLVFVLLAVVQVIYELKNGISWASLSPLAVWVAALLTGWGQFWKEEPI